MRLRRTALFYLFDAILHYVTLGNYILYLAQAVNTIYGLILGCLSPLGLNYVHTAGGSEIKSLKTVLLVTIVYAGPF